MPQILMRVRKKLGFMGLRLQRLMLAGSPNLETVSAG
jgi:hypothetical protein